MKYTDTQIGFQEFPDEISLLINISNCPFHCPGCHSPELWEDIGTELTYGRLNNLIETNKGITLVGFMGGDPILVNSLAAYIKHNYDDIKVGWYWGGETVPKEINEINFDYVKLGPYIKELGGLDNPNTNQRMYLNWYDSEDDVVHSLDITSKFWKHGKG